MQPVLDKHCVSCHNEKAPELSLRADIKKSVANGWSEAMNTLGGYAWARHGGNFGLLRNKRSYSLPMEEGARVSKLYKMLEEGHNGVKLSPEEMRRITLWIDCNSNFFGTYKQIEKQANGEIVMPELGLPEWSDPKEYIR